MRSVAAIATATALIVSVAGSAPQDSPPPRCTIAASVDLAPPGPVLWYRQPAIAWTEALPVGNGRVGAMVFGGVRQERIQLNENSVWEGTAGSRTAPDCAKSLARVRELLFDGKILEAQALASQEMLADTIDDSYQTLGDLLIESPLPVDATEYRRGLDLATGVAVTSWVDRESRVFRTVFASHAVNALVVRQESEEIEGIFLRLSLDRKPSCDGCPLSVTSELVEDGQGQTHGVIHLRGATASGSTDGVRFGADIIIEHDGGSIEVDGNGIVVRAANAVTAYVFAQTDFPYVGAQRVAAVNALREGAVIARPDLEAAFKNMFAALPKNRRDILWDHEKAWRATFDRFDLELGPTNVECAALATDERLKRVGKGESDPGLVALYVQYARALLMGSSVEGGLPANLQGIWCDHLKAPWNADFHININLQMNYWPAEVLNLQPTVPPLVEYVERLAIDGAVTAKRMYGAKGWMAHHATDAWCWTVPAGGKHTVWALWPHGGGWMAQTVHDHWDYGRDATFLRDRAFPLLRGAAEFYLDYLVIDPESGFLVSGPSSSPENTFRLPGGGHADTGMGNTMDQMIIHDLFANLLEEADALGGDAQDDPIVKRVRIAIDKLKPPKIGADGRIMEWADPWEEAEPGHRHMSHLFGVHPGRQITAEATPLLLAAARKSLDFRLANGGGHTGWSRAWLVIMFARLKDGEQAWSHVQMLLAKSTLPNLFDNHPPFQIDGNFGGAAGVAEMLVQSHREVGGGAASGGAAASGNERGHVIELLPALPKEWSRGAVRGICARGGVSIDMMWAEGKLALATVTSSGSEPLRIAWPADAALPMIQRVNDGSAIVAKRVVGGEGSWIEVASAGVATSIRIAAVDRAP